MTGEPKLQPDFPEQPDSNSGESAPVSTSSLYTPEQQQRRDASRWTLVQGILAPAQLLVFVVSLVLIIRALQTGEGYALASASIVLKTALLYSIMVTGSLWEHDVYGKYLFAPAFFWEDVVSMGVIALHTAYLIALFTGALTPTEQLLLALAAYATYIVNAIQFLVKFRQARLSKRAQSLPAPNPHRGAVVPTAARSLS
ncbi:MAG: 2-vinyl bacteriochlorophyllide hydratase [Burkholderiaceae bacterium]